MNAREVDFMIELGDFKDLTQNKAATLPILDQAEAEFAKFNGPRYHVLGNHDFDMLSRMKTILVAGAALLSGAAAAYESGTIHIPDPSVFVDGGRYYLIGTENSLADTDEKELVI